MLIDVWQDFLDIVKEEVGSRVVETWLKAVTISHWQQESKTMYVQAPNTFVKDWISAHYTDLFRIHLGRLLHETAIKIIFLSPVDQKEVIPASLVQLQKNPAPLKVKNTSGINVSYNKQTTSMNPDYTFETFVVGSNNSLAYAAARAISDEPGIHYNPLFIYGRPGLGKTHLLHAIGNYVQQNNKNTSVMYQTTDRFVSDFIAAIRFNKVSMFQQKYRKLDVLLLDDIQFISNKEQTQEAFFHIFNVLYDLKKQIVFSSDLFPHSINGLEDRLRSRLEGGLIVDISKPLLETKIAILKKKAALHNQVLTEELAEYIAQEEVSNVRELEGLLIRVIAFGSLTRQPISLELAHKVLHQSKGFSKLDKKIDFEKITAKVCKFYAYKLSDLRSETRAKEISQARQIAMYLMKKLTDKSLKEIGTYLCRKDHSTVIHAFDRIQTMLKNNTEIRTIVEKLEQEIMQ